MDYSVCGLSEHKSMQTRVNCVSKYFLAHLGGSVLGGSADDMIQHTFFFWCCMVSIGGWVRRFVLMVMVMEGGDATEVFGIFRY